MPPTVTTTRVVQTAPRMPRAASADSLSSLTMRRSLLVATAIALLTALLGAVPASSASTDRVPAAAATLATVQFDDTKSYLDCYDQGYSYDLHLPAEAVAWELTFQFFLDGKWLTDRITDRQTGPDSGRAVMKNRCEYELQAGVQTVKTVGIWYDANDVAHEFPVADSTFRSVPAKLNIRLTAKPKNPKPITLVRIKFRVTHETPDGMVPTPAVHAALEIWDVKKRKWRNTFKTPFSNNVKYMDERNWVVEHRTLKFRARVLKSSGSLLAGKYSNVLVIKPRKKK